MIREWKEKGQHKYDFEDFIQGCEEKRQERKKIS